MSEFNSEMSSSQKEQLGSKVPKRRRRQHSSCQACRRAKIGCDAATVTGTKCSNCLRRKQHCIVSGDGHRKEQIEEHKADTTSKIASKSFGQRNDIKSAANLPPLNLEQETSRQHQSLLLQDMLWDVFIRVFELRISSWMASGCCPFREQTSLLAQRPLLSTLVVRLDKFLCNRGVSSFQTAGGDHRRSQEDESLISQAFRSAIYAFSMRWLRQSKSTSKDIINMQAQKATSNNVWHQARQKISSAMSLPSYRSTLALHVFGLTPVPPDHHDEQIRDLCTEIALNHHNRLREENSIVVSSYLAAASVPQPDQEKPKEQANDWDQSILQDMLYWFGVLEDTSRSVRRSCPSIIPGWKDVWSLVEVNENQFEETFGPLRFFDEPISDDTATIILQHASASNKMFWATIAPVQEAMKLQRLPLLQAAISTAFMRLLRFDEVFKLLLDRCSRDILLLNEQNQLSYFLITLHFHLAVLILLDIVPESLKTESMIFEHKKIRKGSCVATVNALSAALQIDGGTLQDSFTGSILLLDPTPEGLILVIQRTASSLRKLHEEGEISTRALGTMLPVLLSGMRQLSEICQGTSDDIAILEKTVLEIKDHACEIDVLASGTKKSLFLMDDQN